MRCTWNQVLTVHVTESLYHLLALLHTYPGHGKRVVVPALDSSAPYLPTSFFMSDPIVPQRYSHTEADQTHAAWAELEAKCGAIARLVQNLRKSC